MNATLTAYDKLVLAHEFSHTCNDYASYGSAAGWTCRNSSPRVWNIWSLCYGGKT